MCIVWQGLKSVKIALCMNRENENLSHARKGRIEQQINGQRHQLLCISLRFIVSIACRHSKASTELWGQIGTFKMTNHDLTCISTTGCEGQTAKAAAVT